MGWNEYAGVHTIKDVFLRDIKNGNISIGSDEYNRLHAIYMDEVAKWCNINGKKFDNFHQNFAEKIIDNC